MHAPICMNAEHHLLEGQHSIHANAPDEKLKARREIATWVSRL